jgi:hypothetical protein
MGRFRGQRSEVKDQRSKFKVQRSNWNEQLTINNEEVNFIGVTGCEYGKAVFEALVAIPFQSKQHILPLEP